MNKLISFVKQFAKTEIEELNHAEKIGKKYFYIPKELKDLKDKIVLEPYSAGLPLGQINIFGSAEVFPKIAKTSLKKKTNRLHSQFLIKNNKFMPSIALLDILSKYTNKKAFLNKKGETLFLYNKDVFEDNIEKIGENSIGEGVCLVLNSRNEVLGYGELKKGKKIILKNILDRGDFLRRERH